MNDRGLPARLRVVGELGRGGMGLVLAAVDEALGRPVAVKVLFPEATGREDRERLLREARALAQLTSPHAVRVYEAGPLPDGGVYVVMERLEGETLEARLERGGPLPLSEALAVVRELLDALAEAHDAGLVHRDVKPSNVMLVRHASGAGVKLLDFGLVQILSAERLTATGDAVGSPAYMAPEQIRAERGDRRTDVWAVGVTLHEMLTGERPFPKVGAALLVSVLSEAPRPLPPRVPPEVRALVARCLAKDPAARFPDARALRAAVDTLTPAPLARATAAPPAGTANANATSAPRGGAGMFLLGVAVAIAAGGVAVGVVLARRAPTAAVPSASAPPPAPSPSPPPSVSVVPLVAEPTVDASVARAPREARSPAPVVAERDAQPRRVTPGTPGACACLAQISVPGAGTAIGRAVCLAAEPPTCTCRRENVYEYLCRVPRQGGECQEGAKVWPAAPEGTPCRGHTFDGPEAEGHLECKVCTGRPVYLGARQGAACRGMDGDGKSFAGAWDCAR